MSLKSTVSSGLTRLLFAAYTDRVERITKRLGIHSALASAYWAVQSRLHDDSVTVSVAGHEATFGVSTVWEYYRFHDLMGEDIIIADLLSELHADDVFYDVGANVGMYACFVAQELPDDQVVAFEPHPANVSTLEDNLELNDARATIQQYGLSDTETEAELSVQQDGAGEGRHALAVLEDSGTTLSIALERGDSMIADEAVPAPTVIKVDVEGAEVGVLEGLRNALQHDCRLCYVEVHPDRIPNYDATVADLEQLFEECGFAIESIHERNDDEYFLKAKRSLTER